MDMLTRLRRLTRLRHVAIAVIAFGTVAVALGNVLGRDLFPGWIDAVLGLSGLAGLTMLIAGEGWAKAWRAAYVSESKSFATMRLNSESERHEAQLRRQRIANVLDCDEYPAMVFQPIVDLRTMRTAGYESLSRFESGTPDVWFADAAKAGLGLELELKAVRRALDQLELLPAGRYLSVNCCSATLFSDELFELVAGYDCARIVVELTEQLPVDDYGGCRVAVKRLRELGVRLAIDDLGAGYASLSHVIELQPEIIKLDRELANVAEPSVHTMVQTLVTLGRLTGAAIIAEGLEDYESLRLVREHGVEYGQGWHFGKALPLAELLESERTLTTTLDH
jgi:EAL domain-containing protein (putative c-di-GMP-specific phosphodiesterase class I)